eukprot:gene555-3941_t
MTCPLFRQHGAWKETAIWAYGAEDEKMLGDIIRLRASLKGYILQGARGLACGGGGEEVAAPASALSLQEMRKLSATGRPLNRPLP